MTVWTTVNENERYAIAVYNFKGELSSDRLDINVGELLEIAYEGGGWYRGRCLSRKPQQWGLFPKTYVNIMDCTVDRTGSEEIVSLVQTPIVKEITLTLRDWGQHWKELYVTRGDQFKFIELSMRALLELRSAILSGTLPVDQLRREQKTAIYTIDKGNRALGMDLTVRSSATGRQIDPEEISTCQLYTLHLETSDKIRQSDRNSSQMSVVSASYNHSTGSYSFFASVRNFVCKMTEDAELLMSLYDGATHRHFTESYVVKWSKGGLATDIDQLHNLRVLFTDLGISDIKREKVYLVCYVVRIGGMDASSIESRRSSVTSALSNSSRVISQFGSHFSQNGEVGTGTRGSGAMRRPFGVAAMEVTHMLSGQVEVDDDKQYYVPFFPCEKDNLDSLLRKIISNKDLKSETKTGQGLWISVKLLHGDMKQIREEVPHLVVGNVSIARKMGFPEVILPGDARNDLYMTLVGGSFTRGGGKSTDRNIEVTVRVCNSEGRMIPGVISLGGGVQPLDEYNSVVYYHDDRPRWHEIFKICVPIEEFKQAHVVFLFKHRSSNEAKDKSEKPFGLAYSQLMQANGTTLNDTQHTLCVYKVDPKKWPSSDMEAASCYLSLPSLRANPQNGDKEKDKVHKGFLSFVQKDSFVIETNVCSTKLTQNVELLGVLNWGSRYADGTLRTALETLRTVPGSDVVKFLQDILDALFNILTKVDTERGVDSPGCTDGDYDSLVFECLICLIMLVSDRKYHHFQPVLDVYIKDSFCATLVYKKLIHLLRKLVLSAGTGDNEILLRSMKCLEYLVRFIVRSRQLHTELTHGADENEFYEEFQGLLESMVSMMQCSGDASLTSQGACIKYLPSTAIHIITVFPRTQLSKMIGQILDVLPLGRLTKQRLMAVLDIVQGPLFLSTECRCILLPHFTTTLKILIQNHDETNRCGVEIRSKNRSVDKIARVLGASRRKLQEHRGYSEQLELCIRILGEILTLTFKKDVGSTTEEFKHLARSMLRTIIQAFIQMDRENPIMCYLASVLLEMLRQMNMEQYSAYLSHFVTRPDLLDFLTEIQLVLRDLVEKPVFHSHWADMVNLQNHIILKTLSLFSTTLEDVFFEPFEKQVWSNWFHLAIAFLTQPSLQLELLTANQKRRLATKYGDMRCEGAINIRNMWYNLDQHKMLYVPGLVGPFLEMSLIPETELRKATIPLFFDMMHCEFYSPKYAPETYADSKKDLATKGNFNDFENEMIHKLDVLVEGGKGDAQWRSLFVSLVCKQCAANATLKESGCRFVAIIGRLLDTLLLYRELHDHSSIDQRMQATTTLLDFYSEIDRPEMYIRYVNKLCGLHVEVENWTEAGLSLKLHSKLLLWAATPLAARLRSPRHSDASTHRHLKEALYIDIINYLDKGKMWELAIDTCSELVSVLVAESAYEALSVLHYRLSKLYDALKAPRARPEYFRVGYYGRGYPEFLQNRVFIYRGKEYERLEDFSSRIQNGFPKAELMLKLTAPDHEIQNSPNQHIQINAVEPVPDKENKNNNRPLSDQIFQYQKYNNVKKFRYSRPIRKIEESSDGSPNEFASLWLERTELEISDTLPGILRWFPVVHSRTYEMSPLQVAIETMTNANNVLKALVLEHKSDSTIPLEPLTRKLNGMVDAAVMGGIMNYEKAFFTEEYLQAHSEHKQLISELKDLIATQIPLLEYGVAVHKSRITNALAPLHDRIVECFEKMKTHVQTNYGIKSCDLEKELSMVTMRRRISGLTNGESDMNCTIDNRWSEISTQTNHSSDSGVGSRPQTTTLKSFTSQFNKQANRGSLGSSSALGSLGGLGSFGTGGRSILSMSPAPSPARKRDKDKGRNRKSETSSNSANSPSVSGSQWYTSMDSASGITFHRQSTVSNDIPVPATPIVELRQEVIPLRPLRSEVDKEKRLSQRPQSIQSGTNSNRNSVGTTDSNISAEDDPPPPLPQKTLKSELSLTTQETIVLLSATSQPTENTQPPQNIIISSSLEPNGVTNSPVLKRQDYDTVISPRGSFLYNSLTSSAAILSRVNKNVLKEKAPTPPPKKKHNLVQNT